MGDPSRQKFDHRLVIEIAKVKVTDFITTYRIRGLSSHPVGVEFSPLKQIYSPLEKDHQLPPQGGVPVLQLLVLCVSSSSAHRLLLFFSNVFCVVRPSSGNIVIM